MQWKGFDTAIKLREESAKQREHLLQDVGGATA